MNTPLTTHLVVVYNLLQYLKSTLGQGLFFPAQNFLHLSAYADANWGNYLDTCKSTTGFCVFLGDALILWKPVKQGTVPKSSTESEYRALSSVASEVVQLKRLLGHFEVDIGSIMLFCDNKPAIHLTSNPSYHERLKYIDIDCHFIRELVQSNIFKLIHVKTQHQIVDIFTKPLPTSSFTNFIRKLGIIENLKVI